MKRIVFVFLTILTVLLFFSFAVFYSTELVDEIYGLSLEDKTVTYNGDEHHILVEGDISDTLEVEYFNNGKVNSGTYEVSAKITNKTSNEVLGTLSAALTINKKDITLNYGNTVIVYDGEAHNNYVVTSSDIIDGDVVLFNYEYSGDMIEVGTYTLFVSTENTNYNIVNNETTITIQDSNGIEGYLTYLIVGNEVTITGVTDTKIEYAVIPEEIQGYPVTSIGEYAFAYCTSLTNITIPSSVTSIEEYAFAYCIALTSISIPSSVTIIEECTFTWCTSLTSITIPSSVTSIEKGAFELCSSLTTLTFEEGSQLKSIADEAFYACSKLTSVTIPSSVTSIAAYAFCNCSSLKSIIIPSTVTSVGYGAFSSCRILKIYTPLTEKPSGWSYSWNSSNCIVVWDYLNAISIVENGITYLVEDGYAQVIDFDSSTTNVVILNSVTINGVTYPVTSIRISAFYNCNSLTTVTIEGGSQLTSIEEYAFFGCTSLTSITIPSGVTSIGPSAFYECSSLTTITFEEGIQLENIESYTFYNCSKLTNITIPESVTSIGDSAFCNCKSLTNITIPSNVTYLGSHSFGGCSSLTSITIPSSVKEMMSGTFSSCTSLTTVIFEEGCQLTSIWSSTFSGCKSLTSITIPSSITSIAAYAFYNCSSLTSITIPESVTSIGERAFIYCSSLTIYTSLAEQPSGWDSNWNHSNCSIVWGYDED